MLTIKLSAHEVSMNRTAIKECTSGEMCKIMRIENTMTGETEHVLFPDIVKGWPFPGSSSYHGTITDGLWQKTALGVFLLISKTDTADGGCTLEFTDDLNPDLP